MEEEIEESLQRSVFTKLQGINHLINEVTIGPNSVKKKPTTEPSNNTSISPKPTTPKTTLRPAPRSPFIETGIPTRQLLKLIELERQQDVRAALNKRINMFKQFSKNQAEQCRKAWLQAQQAFIEDMTQKELSILEEAERCSLNKSAEMARLTQDSIEKMKQRQATLENEKLKLLVFDRIQKIKSNQQKYVVELEELPRLLKSCIDPEQLKKSSDLNAELLSIHADLEGVVEKCKGNNVLNITNEDVEMSADAIAKLMDYKNKFKSAVEKVNNDKKREIVLEEKRKAEAALIIIEPKPMVTLSDPKANEKMKVIENINSLNRYVNLKDLQKYEELKAFCDNYRKDFHHFESGPLKKFKQDCTKAVNLPINSLSGFSSADIQDKYRKIYGLLAGQSVVVGNTQVNPSGHPLGVLLCMDLIAEKFVLQGDYLISSNPESAFSYASVMLTLWNDFPNFGKLLLAHFYEQCPYLVPYYLSKNAEESDEDFYKKLGYRYINGEIEKQDKFLKRMIGITKLYFAMMITKPKKDHQSSPFNLKQGWKWLGSFLNLEPQIDISAIVLHTFLETVGFEMQAKYKNVFERIMHGIASVFLPKCKQMECTGGAVARLESIIENYYKNKRFEQPRGYEAYAFW